MPALSNALKSHMSLNPTFWGMTFGTIAVCIWGAYLALSRYALGSSELGALDITFLRGTVAGSTMLIWLALKPKKNAVSLYNVGMKKALILASFVGPPFVLLSVQGYAYAPLAHGGVLLASGVVLTGLVLSSVLLKELVPKNKVVGGLIIIAGLLILSGPMFVDGNQLTLLGDLLFFISGMMWAGFAVAQKFWQVSPVVATACVSIASIGIYSPIYLLMFGFERLRGVAIEQIIIQGFVQGFLTGVIAMILFGSAVRLIGAAKTSMFPAILPITTLLIGIPLTGELLTIEQSLGTITVLAGLFYGLRKHKTLKSN